MERVVSTADFSRSILALAVWREAHEDSVDAMLCIGHTIANLAALRNLDFGEAILRHRELHHLHLGHECSDIYPDVRDPKFGKLLRSIAELTEEKRQDLTNGAIYYVDISKPLHSWQEHVMYEGVLCSHQGSRHFFKDKDLTPK